MNFLKQVIKDGLTYLATMTDVILCACILVIESLSKGKGKINCVVNIPRWKSKVNALEVL